MKNKFLLICILTNMISCSNDDKNLSKEDDTDYLKQLENLVILESKCKDSLNVDFFKCKDNIEMKRSKIWRNFYSSNTLKLRELNLNSEKLEQLEIEKLKYSKDTSLENIIIMKIVEEQTRLISEYYNN